MQEGIFVFISTEIVHTLTHMKKVLFLIVLAFAFVAKPKAQYVAIPDTNFGKWLNTHGYNQCLMGNSSVGWQMDTTCNAVINATWLDCSSINISNLNGIEYFDNLDSLDCSGNQLLSIPTLPAHLVFFLCYYNHITALPSLPLSLRELGCSMNELTALPTLPPSIKWLLCTQNNLTTLPELPDSLRYLWISQNPISCMPRLKRIVDLEFTHTNIICVPNKGEVTSSNPALDTIPVCDSANSGACAYCYAGFSLYPDTLNSGWYYGTNQSYSNSPGNFLWEFGDGDTSSLPYPLHNYNTPGHYNVCSTISNNSCINTYCDSSFYVFKTEGGLMSQLKIIDPSLPTSINEEPLYIHFNISPNPTSTILNITTNKATTGSDLTITDLTGRIVMISKLLTASNQRAIDIPNGIYFAIISNGQQSVTRKLIVSK